MNNSERYAWLQQQVADRDRCIAVAENEVRRLQRILLIDGAGATACLTGEPITSNPYAKPSEDWHLWRQGWERIEYKALATEMAAYIDRTKALVSMVTLESDDKPSSPETAQANRLLARWDALKDGRAYVIDNRIGPNFGSPIWPRCRECGHAILPYEMNMARKNEDGYWHHDCANAPSGG